MIGDHPTFQKKPNFTLFVLYDIYISTNCCNCHINKNGIIVQKRPPFKHYTGFLITGEKFELICCSWNLGVREDIADDYLFGVKIINRFVNPSDNGEKVII